MTTDEPESLPAIHALVFVRLPGPDPAPFRRFLATEPEVDAAWHVVGDIDLVVKVDCPSLPDLDRLITEMRTRGGAAATVTHLVVGAVDLSPTARTAIGPALPFDSSPLPTPTLDGTTPPASDGTTPPASDGTTPPASDGTTPPGSNGSTSPVPGAELPRPALPPTGRGWRPPHRDRQAGRRTAGAGAAR